MPIARRDFLGMSAIALPFTAQALAPQNAWQQAANWVKTGRIGALRHLYGVLSHGDTPPLQDQAETQLKEIMQALNLSAPSRQQRFQTENTCMLRAYFPKNLEATLHLAPTPLPGPEFTLHGSHGRIEISHGVAQLKPLR